MEQAACSRRAGGAGGCTVQGAGARPQVKCMEAHCAGPQRWRARARRRGFRSYVAQGRSRSHSMHDARARDAGSQGCGVCAAEPASEPLGSAGRSRRRRRPRASAARRPRVAGRACPCIAQRSLNQTTSTRHRLRLQKQEAGVQRKESSGQAGGCGCSSGWQRQQRRQRRRRRQQRRWQQRRRRQQ